MDHTLLFNLYNRYKQRFQLADSMHRDQVADQWQFTIFVPSDKSVYTAIRQSKNVAKASAILDLFDKRHHELYGAIISALEEVTNVEQLFETIIQ